MAALSHVASAASGLLALAAEPRASESVIATPVQPALIIALCVAAGLMTWLALPGRHENAVRRIGTVGVLAVGGVLAAMMIQWTVEYGGMGVYFWLFSAVALFASLRVITHTKPVYSALYFVLTVFATGGLFVLLWAEFIAAALVLIYAGAILITYVFVIMLASEAVTGGTGDSANLVSDHDGNSRDPFWASLTGFAVTGLLIFVVFDKNAALDRNTPALAIDSAGTPKVLYADGHVDWAKSVWHSGPVSDEEAHRIFAAATPPDAAQQAASADTKTAELSPDLGSAQALGQELLENQALNVQLAAVILTVAMVGAITLARRRVLVVHQPGTGRDMLGTPATPNDDNPHSIAVYGTDNPRHKAYPEN